MKLKDLNAKFTIVYNGEDMSENEVYREDLTKREKQLILKSNDGYFILDNESDLDEIMEMAGIYGEEDWNRVKDDFSLSEFFEWDEEEFRRLDFESNMLWMYNDYPALKKYTLESLRYEFDAQNGKYDYEEFAEFVEESNKTLSKLVAC